jgi:hypothetical protein
MRLIDGDHGLGVGARTVFEIQKGPAWIRWVAEHTACEEGRRFVDEQRQGPFGSWRHEHRFLDQEGGLGVLEDEVTWSPPGGWLGAVAVPMLMATNDRLFRFRHARLLNDLGRHHAFAAVPRKKVAITGASGLVGGALAAFLTTGGHEVVRVVRGQAKPGECRWDPAKGEIDVAALEGVDAIVHLAGAPVAQRWTEAGKAEIRDSRVLGTRTVVDGIRRMARRPATLVSASAIGIYGDRGDEVLAESSSPGEGFLAEVALAWEAEAAPVRDLGVRLAHPRIGIVLDASGGALAAMLPAFRAGGGGTIGTGEQFVSWITLDDLLALILHMILDPAWEGAYNATAPGPVRQVEQARDLANALGVFALAPLPAFAVRGMMGEMGQHLLLAGQRVVPARAEAAGFKFTFTDHPAALRATLGL